MADGMIPAAVRARGAAHSRDRRSGPGAGQPVPQIRVRGPEETHSRRADPRRQARPRTRCRGRGWRRSCAGQGPVPDEAELPCPGGACWDSLRGLRDT